PRLLAAGPGRACAAPSAVAPLCPASPPPAVAHPTHPVGPPREYLATAYQTRPVPSRRPILRLPRDRDIQVMALTMPHQRRKWLQVLARLLGHHQPRNQIPPCLHQIATCFAHSSYCSSPLRFRYFRRGPSNRSVKRSNKAVTATSDACSLGCCRIHR